MAGAGMVSAKKMFGEYGIYCGDKMVALFCDDQLYVKPTDQGKAFAGKLTEAAPYPGAKGSVALIFSTTIGGVKELVRHSMSYGRVVKKA